MSSDLKHQIPNTHLSTVSTLGSNRLGAGTEHQTEQALNMKLFFTAVFFAVSVIMSAIARPGEGGQSPGGPGHIGRDSDFQFTK